MEPFTCGLVKIIVINVEIPRLPCLQNWNIQSLDYVQSGVIFTCMSRYISLLTKLFYLVVLTDNVFIIGPYKKKFLKGEFAFDNMNDINVQPQTCSVVVTMPKVKSSTMRKIMYSNGSHYCQYYV